LSLEQWADFFLENYSKPPMRAEKTHQVNLRVAKHIKGAFGPRKLVEITADDIELYLRDRIRKTVRVKNRARLQANGSAQTNYGSSGAKGSQANAERGGAQKTPASQSLLGR
jgi:hypothetical protein